MSNAIDQKSAPVRRRKRIGMWTLMGTIILILAAIVYGMSLLGTQILAPDWVRARIAERINRDAGAYEVSFGEVSVIMSRDWVPRLMLRDIAVRDDQGQPVVKLSDIQGTVALRPLMRGQLQPASIRLSGAQVLLRRAKDGAVNLSVGDTGSTVDEASGIVALIDDLDEFLLRSQFADLHQVEADNLTIRYEDARADKAWTVDGGRMALTRGGEDVQIRGDFALLGARAYATTLELNYSGQLGNTAAEFGFSFEDMPASDIAGQSPALAWLGALEAPISGALRGAIDTDGNLGPLNATLQIGEGALRPTEATKPVTFTSARAYFTYDPQSQSMQIDEFLLDSNWVSARAEGKAHLIDVENGLPGELLGQIRVTDIKANPDGFYASPVSVDMATMDLRLEIDPFRISLGEMSFADQGSRFVLNGELEAKPEGWNLAIDGHMDKVGPDRLMELWPERVKAVTREWVAENVMEAELSNIQLAVRSVPGHRPDIFLGFDFAGLKTRFMKKMPLIEEGSGHASLYGDRFVITADAGHVVASQGGRIDVSGTSFIVPDVRLKRGPAKALLSTKSTITAALSLLDEEPLQLISKAGQSVTLADGQARATGQLDFLLKPKLTTKEVTFDVTAELSNVRSETLVPERVLAAAELDVVATNDEITISGDGRIGTVPAAGQWRTKLGDAANGKSQLSGSIELSERFADEFGIGLPPGSISGAGRADIEIEFDKGKPGRFVLTSDLAGVGLALRPLGWSMGKGTRGSLNVSGALGEPPSIDRLSFNAGGLRADGTVKLKPNGQLDRAAFSQVRVGTWLNAPVELIGRGATVTPAVVVKGGTIDLRQTSLGGDGSSGSGQARNGGPVTLALDSLQISDGIALTSFRADLNMSRGVEGSFAGRVNGGTPIEGQVVPQGNRSAFRIRSANAGGVMSSAGLLKQARDGAMDLILTPAAGPGSYNGKLGIDGFRLKEAPAMAALLNAISVVGILEQLDSEGLHFSRVDAKFLLTPQRVTLYEGSAVGASLGISMDGYYYMESGQMDMQGVFSPLYLVNAIGGIFTRKGEGLIGFNYTLKGPAASPRVQVNPLSALTPGLFRELFRRPAPKVQRGVTAQGQAVIPADLEPGKPADEKPKVKPDTSR